MKFSHRLFGASTLLTSRLWCEPIVRRSTPKTAIIRSSRLMAALDFRRGLATKGTSNDEARIVSADWTVCTVMEQLWETAMFYYRGVRDLALTNRKKAEVIRERMYSDFSSVTFAECLFVRRFEEDFARLPVFSIFLVVPMWLLPLFMRYFPSALPWSLLLSSQKNHLFYTTLPDRSPSSAVPSWSAVQSLLQRLGVEEENLKTTRFSLYSRSMPQLHHLSRDDLGVISTIIPMNGKPRIEFNWRQHIRGRFYTLQCEDEALKRECEAKGRTAFFETIADVELLLLCRERGLLWRGAKSKAVSNGKDKWSLEDGLDSGARTELEDCLIGWVNISANSNHTNNELRLICYSIAQAIR